MVSFDAPARRARLVARHRLDGSAPSALDAAASVVMLHASDPATVYLSVLARSAAATLASIAAELYEQRLLVRMMGPRRTLFVVPQAAVPVLPCQPAAHLGRDRDGRPVVNSGDAADRSPARR